MPTTRAQMNQDANIIKHYNDYESKFEENISHFSSLILLILFLSKIRTQIDKNKQFEFMNL